MSQRSQDADKEPDHQPERSAGHQQEPGERTAAMSAHVASREHEADEETKQAANEKAQAGKAQYDPGSSEHKRASCSVCAHGQRAERSGIYPEPPLAMTRLTDRNDCGVGSG
ncbi:MAG: hypothetical protein FJ271_25805 [Planctomycetes bacterium]|nr:hypothetical protein [Planctomycetota bacterium]